MFVSYCSIAYVVVIVAVRITASDIAGARCCGTFVVIVCCR